MKELSKKELHDILKAMISFSRKRVKKNVERGE